MTMLAQVAVENTVYHFDKLFTYRVPEHLRGQAAPGTRVLVPFGAGNRERVGMVFSLDGQPGEKLKEIVQTLDREPVLDPWQLEFALWMKDRCYCTLFEAVKQMIPAGLHLRLKDSYLLDSGFTNFDRECFDAVSWQIITTLRAAGRAMPFEKLSQKLGLDQGCPEFQALQEQGIVRKVNLATGRLKDAVARMARPIEGFSGKLTPRQKEVYQVLLDVGEASERELCYFTGGEGAGGEGRGGGLRV